MFTPLIRPVATVESPPQNDNLSNNTTLPSFPYMMVLVVDIPAQPPPTTMAWSLFDSSNTPSTSKRRETSGLHAVAHISSKAGWLRRWSATLACSAARSFAVSVLDRRPVPETGDAIPSTHEVMRNDRCLGAGCLVVLSFVQKKTTKP